jgi:Uma2 family endonuclease
LVALHVHVTTQGLGKVFPARTDVILSDLTVVEPDTVYEGAPTLVVEILSPSTAQTDRHTKMQLYARHGVPWYWIVDPDSRTVEVYALGEGGYALSTRVAGDEQLSAEPLTDLVIPPTSLWA